MDAILKYSSYYYYISCMINFMKNNDFKGNKNEEIKDLVTKKKEKCKNRGLRFEDLKIRYLKCIKKIYKVYKYTKFKYLEYLRSQNSKIPNLGLVCF